LKYPIEAYLRYDPHGDCKESPVIRCHEVRIVKTRKKHQCLAADPHDILPGQLARHEKALVDGEWGGFYICLPCIDEWIDVWGR
jgi:hypothetical protein